jgi:gliding motility-associated-like protein
VVYNSWGNIVFSSNKSGEFWNGKIDGLPAPTGNYAYRVIATDEAGERLEKSGFFALIR